MTEISSLWQLLQQGGWMMVPIYGCSLLALVVVLRKTLEFRRCRTSQLEWFESAVDSVEAHDFAHARLLCSQTSHPAAPVVAGMIRALRERPERIEAEAQRIGDEEIARLERGLGLLAFVAEVAPLLGLLGTVVGMVDLFMSMQGASQGAVAMAALSSGIWKALLTTAAGLAVAVPALAANSYFVSRIDALRSRLDGIVSAILFVAPEIDARPPIRALHTLNTTAELAAE
jgi:biopolymer transport protein ExbB